MIGFIKKMFGPSVDFKQLLQQGAIILDVRSSGEYNGGHLKGAMNIPVDRIQQRINEIKTKGKPVITCCASGMRSSMAAGILQKAGIEAYNGGAWQSLNQYLH